MDPQVGSEYIVRADPRLRFLKVFCHVKETRVLGLRETYPVSALGKPNAAVAAGEQRVS